MTYYLKVKDHCRNSIQLLTRMPHAEYPAIIYRIELPSKSICKQITEISAYHQAAVEQRPFLTRHTRAT